MTTTDKLRDALELLQEAREETGMGTTLMLDSIIDDLASLINRFESIYDESENDSTQRDE